jgi:hypothetical protein
MQIVFIVMMASLLRRLGDLMSSSAGEKIHFVLLDPRSMVCTNVAERQAVL